MLSHIISNWNEVPVVMDLPFAARIVGQKYETIKRRAGEGTFPAYKEGGEWRVEKETLRQYIENNCVMKATFKIEAFTLAKIIIDALNAFQQSADQGDTT